MKLIDLDFKDIIKDNSCFKTLQKLTLPDKSIEEFKQFSLDDIYNNEYNLEQNSSSSIKEFEYLKKDEFYYIFISNSQFISQHSLLGENITFIQDKKNYTETSNALHYLAESFLEQQNQITINKTLDKPLLIINIYKNENSFIPTSLTINLS